MLSIPISKLDVSCSCTECNTLLRPLPRNQPPIQLLLNLLPSTPGLGFSLPPTAAANPLPYLEVTSHTAAHLRPRVPTLVRSPTFLLTRFHSQKSPKDSNSSPLALSSLSLELLPISSLTAKRIALANRSLWAHMSSVIDECGPPLSANILGLAACAQTSCSGKVVPRFGHTVCGACEAELRGAMLEMITDADLFRDQDQGDV